MMNLLQYVDCLFSIYNLNPPVEQCEKIQAALVKRGYPHFSFTVQSRLIDLMEGEYDHLLIPGQFFVFYATQTIFCQDDETATVVRLTI